MKKSKRSQEYPDPETLDRDLLIWAAGFFDGEGCVNISKQKSPGHNWYGFTLNIAVSQKTKAPLERLHQLFGGHLFEYKTKGVTYYRWQQWSHGALNCLMQLYPWLLVKHQVADNAIRFQVQMTEWNSEFGRRGYPDHVIVGREIFYLRGRELNKLNRTNNKAPKYEGAIRQDGSSISMKGTSSVN